MKIGNRIYRCLIAVKNRQIRLERERVRAFEETNRILSAYIAILVEKQGGARIPKELVREALGCYKISVKDSGDDYLIEVASAKPKKCGFFAEKSGTIPAVAVERDAYAEKSGNILATESERDACAEKSENNLATETERDACAEKSGNLLATESERDACAEKSENNLATETESDALPESEENGEK